MVNENNSHTVDLAALKRGDKHAFAQNGRDSFRQIYRLALKMLGDEQDAEDVLQEVFIKAYQKHPRL
jgi:RNA polymerase sigma-70 factor, ECF subfamily